MLRPTLLLALSVVTLLRDDTTAQPGPQPDVYLASLSVEAGVVRVGAPVNITSRPGYDNQPSFSRDGGSVYFTSTREDAQADIYRYDIASRQTTRVTTTSPESEYSAAVLPDGAALGVIRVERDSTQRLWRFPLGEGAPSVLLERVRPAGYFAFADDHLVVLFVLGSPNTLQLADTRTGRADTITTNVGRSLHRIPGARAVSFVSRSHAATPWVMSLDVATRAVTPLVSLPEGTEDYAWLPDGAIVAGQGSRLLVSRPRVGPEWTEVADFASQRLGGITRLAVSPRGDRLAIVAVAQPQ